MREYLLQGFKCLHALANPDWDWRANGASMHQQVMAPLEAPAAKYEAGGFTNNSHWAKFVRRITQEPVLHRLVNPTQINYSSPLGWEIADRPAFDRLLAAVKAELAVEAQAELDHNKMILQNLGAPYVPSVALAVQPAPLDATEVLAAIAALSWQTEGAVSRVSVPATVRDLAKKAVTQ